jgi:hypothetical protein
MKITTIMAASAAAIALTSSALGDKYSNLVAERLSLGDRRWPLRLCF